MNLWCSVFNLGKHSIFIYWPLLFWWWWAVGWLFGFFCFIWNLNKIKFFVSQNFFFGLINHTFHHLFFWQYRLWDSNWNLIDEVSFLIGNRKFFLILLFLGLIVFWKTCFSVIILIHIKLLNFGYFFKRHNL